jgi:phosphatidylserine/phosphatidylglycerophosphate/cardiolipin synthase-like enzyme
MVGSKDGGLNPLQAQASEWSNEVLLSAGDGAIQANFNRGIVASQWLSRRLGDLPANAIQTTLTDVIATPNNAVRNLLAGSARTALLAFLAEAQANPNATINAAIFELNDPELVDALCAMGARANIVLSNGTVKHAGEDENGDARTALGNAHVHVIDRMTAPAHLAHNKFAVLSDGATHQAVLTGSTNWTKTGLCTQANNVLVVRDEQVASWYFDYWQRLADLGSVFPPSPRVENDKARSTIVGSTTASPWFTPVDGEVDLDAAKAIIAGAKQGILFLMFNPGPVDTLLTAILERGAPGSPDYDANLFVHGVVNQDPSTKTHPVTLYHRGEATHLGADIVKPAAIESKFGFWQEELKNYSIAMVHSKVVIVDAFGEHPVVMTGSHNMGPKASGGNDDNLIILTGDERLAEAYAVNISGIYNQYRWRQRVLQGSTWRGLWDNDHWQSDYFQKPEFIIEAEFWLGEN